MELVISMFLVGIGVGCALHEFIIAIAIQRMPHSVCDYCEWHKSVRKLSRKKQLPN